MSAVVRRFVSPADKLRRDEHERARSALVQLRDAERPEVQFVYDEAIAAIDRRSAVSSRSWVFVMVGPVEFGMVSEHLAATSVRPLVALRLWALLFQYVDRDTGDISLSRDRLAELLGVPADDVSRITSELVACGAISRRRVRLAGMRGPGAVRYTLNPLVGTHLPGRLREAAQAAAPRLSVVPGERRGRAPLRAVPVL